MNKNIDKKTIGVILSFVVLAGIVFGFGWLYLSSEKASSEVVTGAANIYQPIEIESVKKDAQNLIADKENIGGLPLKSPAAESLGRTNPFTGI